MLKVSAGREQAAATGVQLLVPALLGAGIAGWLAATAYAAALQSILAFARHRRGIRFLGPADHVTLARAVLVGGVVTLVADRATVSVVFLALASVALVLDAVDGQVARRTRTVSPLGARFDMEVDAVLILALSVQVAASLGAWVLAIGLMRYAFAAAAHPPIPRLRPRSLLPPLRSASVPLLRSRTTVPLLRSRTTVPLLRSRTTVPLLRSGAPVPLLRSGASTTWPRTSLPAPWLRSPLPVSLARKAVAALQGVVLVVAASGFLPPAAAIGLTAFALAALLWSFGRDLRWLWLHRPVPPIPAPDPIPRPAPSPARVPSSRP